MTRENDKERTKIFDPVIDESWVGMPRSIKNMFMENEITQTEYFLYLHLRVSADIYGKTTSSISFIRESLFGNKLTKNYINKVLLSLRDKKLIWYEKRQGKAGSFSIYFDNFFLKKNKVTSLDKYFESEVSAEVSNPIQKMGQKAIPVEEVRKSIYTSKECRSKNNDNDKKSITTESVSNKSKGYEPKTLTEGYQPNGSEQLHAFNIAETVGEKYMDWYLILIKKNQFWALEKAYGEYDEDIKNGKVVKNPPAYINRIVQRILKEKVGKSL